MRISSKNTTQIIPFTLAFLVVLAGCDGFGGGNGEPEDISRTWTGSIESGGQVYAVALRLAATGTYVSGSFSVTGNGVDRHGSLTGSYADGDASLTLYIGGAEAGTMSLTFEDDEASGTATSALTGLSGTVNLSV